MRRRTVMPSLSSPGTLRTGWSTAPRRSPIVSQTSATARSTTLSTRMRAVSPATSACGRARAATGIIWPRASVGPRRRIGSTTMLAATPVPAIRAQLPAIGPTTQPRVAATISIFTALSSAARRPPRPVHRRSPAHRLRRPPVRRTGAASSTPNRPMTATSAVWAEPTRSVRGMRTRPAWVARG